jgi:hypothetical protein
MAPGRVTGHHALRVRDPDAQRNPDANANANADPQANTNTSGDTDPHANTNTVGHGDSVPVAVPHADGYRDTGAFTNRVPDAISVSDTDTNPDTNPHTNPHTNTDPHTNANTDANADPDPHAFADTDGVQFLSALVSGAGRAVLGRPGDMGPPGVPGIVGHVVSVFCV